MKYRITLLCGLCLFVITIIPSSTLCRVFPSHYSFRDDDVIRCENDTNVCTNYGVNADPVFTFINTSQYVKCTGRDIRLSDSDYGPQQYSDSDQDRFYIWKRGDNSRLLFTFPSTVQLTYITLHYYSDSCASLPNISIHEVDSERKIWQNIPSSRILFGNIFDFTQPMEPGGLKSVTHNITGFNCSQLLMVISTFSDQQYFLLSEVEFFNELIVSGTPTIRDVFSSNPNNVSTTTCNSTIAPKDTTPTTKIVDTTSIITTTEIIDTTPPTSQSVDIMVPTTNNDSSTININYRGTTTAVLSDGVPMKSNSITDSTLVFENNGGNVATVIGLSFAIVFLFATLIVVVIIATVYKILKHRKKLKVESKTSQNTQQSNDQEYEIVNTPADYENCVYVYSTVDTNTYDDVIPQHPEFKVDSNPSYAWHS